MKLAVSDLRYLCASITEKYGIETNKVDNLQMQTALEEVAKLNRLSDFKVVLDMIKQNNLTSRQLLEQLVQLFLIGETFFFREPKTFELIANDLIDDQQKDQFDFLCLACSTGQEVYSLAMTLLEMPQQPKFKITGMDLSVQAIAKANLGFYNSFEVQRGLDELRIKKYFTSHSHGFEVKEQVRKHCKFIVDNIVNPRSKLASYDMILCRNVLIYMSPARASELIASLEKYLKVGGYLIFSSTEIVAELPASLKSTKSRGVFKKFA